MPVKKLIDFLDSNDVEYEILNHSPAFTAQTVAASAHVPGKELAKTVMVIVEGTMAMAVLPASYRVDFSLLKDVVGTDNVELASEQEFKNMFPECEIGSMPPFGNLYDMDVYVAERLAEQEEIAFNAGSHRELIRMSFEDFDRLVQPTVMRFAY